MPDYQKGKIYVIRNHVDDEIYIGSTCSSLSKRFNGHKNDMSHGSGMQLYKHVENQGGWATFYIELYENYPCDTKNELHRREGQIQRELKASLNKVIAGRTTKEYRQDNCEHIKAHYEKNKKQIIKYQQEYRIKNEEKVKARVKKHYEDNKDIIRGKQKKHYDENKDKMHERANRVVQCECGIYSAYANLPRHRKSIKCGLNVDIDETKQVKCECGYIVAKTSMTRHLRSKWHKDWEQIIESQKNEV
jgi:hypothetical protein